MSKENEALEANVELEENFGTGETPDVEETPEEPKEENGDIGAKVLVAVYPILFHSHQYNVGDLLPANYPEMVEAWLAAGTAVWKGSDEKKAAKAAPATAETGLPGEAVTSEAEDGENLVGKVPKTAARKKK